MKKISTPVSENTVTPFRADHVEQVRPVISPKAVTLAIIRQFARVYTSDNGSPLGLRGFMAN